MGLDVVFAAILFVLVLALARGTLNPIVLAVGSMLPILVGHAILDAVPGNRLLMWPLFAGHLLAVTIGYVLGRGALAWPGKRLETSAASVTASAFLTVIVGGLAVYHFAHGGIPMLSGNVEVKRFDFTSSGFFGIPGRMYLFGMPFVAVMNTFLVAARPHSGASRWLYVSSWVLLALLQLAAGFKGGLVVTLTLYLFARALSGQSVSLMRLANPKYVAMLIAGAVFAVFVSFQYASVGVSSPEQAAQYLSQRLTVIAAQPGHLAVERLSGHEGEPFIASDLKYFLRKYAHLPLPGRAYPLELYVSSAISGTPLDVGAFIVSVTVGLFPGLMVDFGGFFAVGFSLLVGVFFGGLVAAAARARSLYAAGALSLGVYEFSVSLTNGNPMYYLTNTLAVIAILWVVYRMGAGLHLIARDGVASGTRRLREDGSTA